MKRFFKPETSPVFLFIIGAMKCGTSSLAGALNDHPDIALGAYKEPNFFAERGRKITDLEEFLKGWKRGARYRLDASTCYSKFPTFGDCARTIRQQVPGAKYIYLMRDPIDRIESQVAHQIAKDPARYEDFVRRGEDIRFYRHALIVSSYASQLDLYQPEITDGRMFLQKFEDMLADEKAFLSALWAFLDIEAPKKPLGILHRNKRVTDAPHVDKVKLSKTARAMLRSALADDMAQLHEKYGIDVSSWGF